MSTFVRLDICSLLVREGVSLVAEAESTGDVKTGFETIEGDTGDVVRSVEVTSEEIDSLLVCNKRGLLTTGL